jgi:hypothetical protein
MSWRSPACSATTATPDEATWNEACASALADYVVARARAAGWSEQCIGLLLEVFQHRRRGSPFRITEQRIAIELQPGVRFVIRAMP